MLKQKHWQWLADHHHGVRGTTMNVLLIVFFVYCFLFVKTMFDQGKSDTSYKLASDYYVRYECQQKLHGLYINRFEPGYYSDANPFLLERQYTTMLEARALQQHPECIGAILADSTTSVDSKVYLIYDKKLGRVIYRIARLDDHLKK